MDALNMCLWVNISCFMFFPANGQAFNSVLWLVESRSEPERYASTWKLQRLSILMIHITMANSFLFAYTSGISASHSDYKAH